MESECNGCQTSRQSADVNYQMEGQGQGQLESRLTKYSWQHWVLSVTTHIDTTVQ